MITGPYRKVSTRIHRDQRYKALSLHGKHLLITLLTHPALTQIGGMHFTDSGFAQEIEYSKREMSEALSEIEKQEIIRTDLDNFLLVFPKYLKHNPPVNPNQIVSWAKFLGDLPECELLTRHLTTTREYVAGLGPQFGAALDRVLSEVFPGMFNRSLPEGSNDHSPTLYQEQEQYLDQDEDPPLPPKGAASGNSKVSPSHNGNVYTPDFVAFWALYPKRRAKGRAAKAWAKLRPDEETREKILSAVTAQTRSLDWTREGGRFIPLPATWLNDRRFDDDPPEVPEGVHVRTRESETDIPF